METWEQLNFLDDEPSDEPEPEGAEGNPENAQEGEMKESDELKGKEEEEKPPRKKRGTIEEEKKRMGFNPWIPKGEKKIGPGRAAALALLEKLREEKKKESK